MAPRGLRRTAPALLAGLAVAACAGLANLDGPPPDPGMLRATIGPGADRLLLEVGRERAVQGSVAANGWPDYVWAPTRHMLVLVFLAADRAAHFQGPSRARRLARVHEPIPDAWLERIAPDDAAEIRARRVDLRARAQARPAGWCPSLEEPALPASCRGEAAARALKEEIRQKVLSRWSLPPIAYGGERVIVRFRIAAEGALAERCVLGATSPTAAQTALAAFDAAFPVPALRGGAACLAGAPVVFRFEVSTD